MAAKTHQFPCLSDNFGVLAARSGDRRHRLHRRPGSRARRGRAQGDRLDADRHPGHASSRRPHRRHRRTEEEIQMPRGRTARRSRAHRRRRCAGGRRRHCEGRQPHRPRARNARPHVRPHLLCVRCRQARLCRRHAVLDRMRPRDRRHARADVELAAQAARAARRHAIPLRSRIHAGEHQVRADDRARQCCAARAREGSRCAARRRQADPAGDNRRGEGRQLLSACGYSRSWPPPSAWLGASPPRSSPRFASARTISDDCSPPPRSSAFST